MNKYLSYIFFPFLLIVSIYHIQAQAGVCNAGGCTGGNLFGVTQATVSPTFVNSVAGTWCGEYNLYNVTAGAQYEWSLCTADGAVCPTTDAQLTLINNTTLANLCYADDVCGVQPKILWTATFTGQVRVLINQFSCLTNTNNHTVVWRCASCATTPPGETQATAISAGALNCGSTYTDTKNNSTYANDYNGQPSPDIYYQFSLSATQIVEISHCTSGFDTYMYLLDNTGAIITSNDNNGPLCATAQASIQTTLAAGTYYVVSEGAGANTGSITTQINVVAAPPTVTGNTTICAGATTTLTANSPGATAYSWYDAPTGGTLLGTGATLTVSPSTTTTYYVEAVYGTAVGPSNLIPLPGQSNTFSNSVRGFYFTAPTNFTIVGLQVPTTASAGNQSIAVLRFTAGAPPAFPATTNAFNTLYLTQNNTNTGILPVSIPINAGDIIGVYGVRNDINSYGGTTPVASNIAGFPITLERTGMQLPLSTNVPQSIWYEANYYISRTDVYYSTSTGTCASNRVAVTVTVNPNPVLNPAVTGITCAGANNGTITANVTGGTPTFQYTLNAGAVQYSNFFGNLGPGNYTVVVNDTNSCSATATVNIAAGNPVVVSPVSTPVNCNGGNNGTIAISATGGTSPYQYSLDGVTYGTNNIFTGLLAGNYTAYVQDATGCVFSAAIAISEPTALSISTSTTPVSCNGVGDGTASVVVLGGTLNYSYSWDTNPSQNTATATGLSGGIYTCYVTDGNSCTANVSVTVSEPTVLGISAAASTILCNGGSSTITVSASGGNGGYQYSLNSGAYQAGNTFSVGAGTYSVSVQDGAGCTASTNVTITEPTAVVTANYSELCAINGTTYTVSFDVSGGTGAYTVSGTTGSFTGSSFTSNAIPTGTSVNITVSDANGCAATVITTVGACTPATACNTTTGCYLSNLIVNGDFENFNNLNPFSSFTSAYDYYDCDLNNSVCVNGTTGQNILCQFDFAVETGTPLCNNTWSANIADHTSGTGNMMLVDFPVGLSAEIWGVDVTLTPNTVYCFGAYFMNLVPSGTNFTNPIFRFEANGSILGTSSGIPEDEQWHYQGIQFNSGAGGLVHLSIYNDNFGALGYDMAIDDIMIREVTNGTVPITANDAVNLCDNQGSITFNVLGNDTGTGINSLQLLSYPAFSVGNATADFATGNVTFVPDATFSGTTSFTYLITTNLGCSAVGTIDITEVPSPVANIAGQTTFCQGFAATLDAGAGFASYNWTTPIGTSTAQTVAPIASGTYTLIVTNANNCADTISTVVTVNSLPAPVISTSATAICAGATTTLDAGAGYNIYSWFQSPFLSLGNGQTQIVGLPAVYGVIVVDANGCQGGDTITIGLNANPAPVIVPNGATTFCPGASVDLDAGSGFNSYSWSSIPTGASGSNQVLTATVTGDYIATVTNAAGCSGADTLTVTVIDNIPPIITNCPANLTQNNDAGQCGAVVTWSPLLVTDNCTFTITQTAGLVSGSLFPIGTTTVSYDVTDAGGNTVSCSFTITINDTENPVITNCPANITLANDAGQCGANVAWATLVANDNCPNVLVSQTAGVANGGFFPLGTTNVSYTATDASGNTATCSFSVTVNDTENPLINNCPANITINAASNLCGATVNWVNPTVSDNCPNASISQTAGLANGNVFPLGTSTVTYTATDAAGNSVTCSFTVTVTDNTAPTIVGCPANLNLTATNGCSAAANWTTPTVTDNCSGATIVQTAGAANGTLFPLGTTTVTYLATDANGNTSTCSFTVTVTDNQAPVIAGCPSNIVLSNDAGQCGAVATWTNPTATDNCTLASMGQTQGLANGAFFPLGTTTIQYTAIDAGGNSSICTFTVTVSDTEAPIITGCPSNITQQATQGCSTAVTWNVPTASDNCSGVIQTSTFNSGDVFAIGTTTVTYTATDAVGNTTTCSFNITITPPNPISLVANVVSQVNCNGFANGEAIAVANGGTGLYNYSWATNPAQLTANATGLTAGTYSVFVTDANASACVNTQTATVTITQPNPLVASANVITNSTCEQANGAAIVSATGASGNFVYEWNSNPPQNTALATNLPAGTYIATVTDVNNGQCNTTATVTISTTAIPNATISPTGTNTICEGTTTTFQANGGASYGWLLNGNLVSSGTQFTAQAAGNYQVVAYSNQNFVGCSDTSETATLAVLPQPTAAILATNTSVCEGETVTLQAAGNGAIDWLLNGVSLQNSNNPLTVSTEGNYQAVITNSCGSATSTNTLVQIHANPIAEFVYEPQEPHVGDLVIFTDKSISGAVWAWTFGDNIGTSILQNPSYTYNDSGYYTVMMFIEDIFGCKDSAAHTLFVSGQPTDFIPNLFSPNNDGEFDEFIIEYGNLKLDKFQIFDRWGNRVFITSDPSRGWNGYNENGAPCVSGIYFYAVVLKDAQNKEIVKKGNLTLMR